MRQTINMTLDYQKFIITIETGLFFRLGGVLESQYPDKRIAIITDDDTSSVYGELLAEQMNKANLKWCLIKGPSGESFKDFKNLPGIYKQLTDFRISRNDIIISFGGGTVNDMAGFVAATYQRGINLIKLPTTLIAQVDAAIGSKCAVNLSEGKNMAGTYYQPKAIFIDPGFIRTLPDHLLADGMAEVIKYACVSDPDLFSDLMARAATREAGGLESIIYRCALIKKQALEQDAREKGAALLLNFGHTLGHAIENCYPEGRYRHGNAVAIGMNMVTTAGEKMGLTHSGASQLLQNLLKDYDIDYSLPKDLSAEQLFNAAKLDKKITAGKLDLVILKHIGSARIHSIPLDELQQFIKIAFE
ncbi:MAG: 3-dehydroquinate synthase [Anaerovoracaceae bacterium]|jgi:3-dehydroquinate synthase